MYDKPNKMINMYGRNIYAYVTYLNNNNIHIFPQLLTLAYSLMRCGSRVDKICIVSNDISDDYVIILQKFFIVYRIVDIIINGESYIKYYALTMTQYKKILIIHPNFVILQNPDILFKLNSPAAYIHNHQLYTDLLLLSPELNMFDSMLFDLRNNLIALNQSEYVYNKYYSQHWTSIDNNYFYQNQQIKNVDKVMYVYYKFNPVSVLIADIHQDDIYILWFDIYKSMLEKYPEFIMSPLLSNTNKFLTTIMRSVNLNRPSTAAQETDVAGIKNMYESGEIHRHLVKYYHMDNTNDVIYNNDEIEPLFDNIEEYNFIEPIKKLYEIFKNPYLQHLSTYTTSDMKGLHIYNYMELNDRDNIMIYYLKSFNNISIQILKGCELSIDNSKCKNLSLINSFGNTDKNKLKLDEYKLNGLYYVKTLHLNKQEYENLLFLTEYKLNYQSRIQKIDGLNIPEDNDLTFVFYKNTDSKNTNIINTQMFGELILNQNNLHRLKHQNIRNICTPFFSKSNLYINTLKNWIYFNLSPIERERLILFGDIVLNSYGIKVINKIEGVFVNINGESENEKNISEKIYTVFNNVDSKFYFTNITVENSKEYKKSHKNIIDKIKQKTGITNTLDLVTNSKYFSNYNGLKLLSVELNMCWLDEQTELQKDTDITMTNIINKNILSRFVPQKYLHKLNIKKINKNKLNRIKKNAQNKYIKEFINDV
jgi:hypothetical protein